MRKDYCTKLTKEDLIKGGITLITEDCQVFGPDGKQKAISVNAQGYLQIAIYDVDEDGNKIKMPIKRKTKGCKEVVETYIYKTRVIGLHRAMWAWFSPTNEVPEGYVVDHISNKHTDIEDYKMENLQLLTPFQNIMKDKDIENDRVIKCNLRKNIDFYLAKLDVYLQKYSEAKKNHEANAAHLARCNISYTKARIRYWLINNGFEKATHDWYANNEDYTMAVLKFYRLKDIMRGE